MAIEERRVYGAKHCVVDIINNEGMEFLEAYDELRGDKNELLSTARSIAKPGGRCTGCIKKEGEFTRNDSLVQCSYYKTLDQLLTKLKSKVGKGDR